MTTPSGTAASSGNFTVKPTILSFSPTSGSVGATVTIIGTGSTGVTAVNFHGTASDSFAVDFSTKITARVPADATTGSIAVTIAGGTATSSAPFTVLHRRSVTLSLTGGLTASGSSPPTPGSTPARAVCRSRSSDTTTTTGARWSRS